MSQPVVAARLGVVVLGARQGPNYAGEPTSSLPQRLGHVAGADGLDAPWTWPDDEFIAVATPIGRPGSHTRGSVGKSH